MKKVEKKVADDYFKLRTTLIIIYLAVGVCVSYLVVFFARDLSSITFNGFPLHYYMGAQGAVLTFIILLFVNAFVSDKIDQKFGIRTEEKTSISSGKTLDQ
ncbi:DUF4212 domain-containing protein [Radiobacillus kanasensis]|uniref:DUF4212 domain-containing protein n=1 Tax=Radiobacillus kanasensis TaxID=2844358 RepID=UPI001E4116E8|nr:DUF4212 domain-containing protein [Radiobacillus kanasensis]UFT98295.1 DUF4212 domain-containing protein [Radiobacillus kanasensis]